MCPLKAGAWRPHLFCYNNNKEVHWGHCVFSLCSTFSSLIHFWTSQHNNIDTAHRILHLDTCETASEAATSPKWDISYTLFDTREATSGPLNSHTHILTRFPSIVNTNLEYTPPPNSSCTNSTFHLSVYLEESRQIDYQSNSSSSDKIYV